MSRTEFRNEWNGLWLARIFRIRISNWLQKLGREVLSAASPTVEYARLSLGGQKYSK